MVVDQHGLEVAALAALGLVLEAFERLGHHGDREGPEPPWREPMDWPFRSASVFAGLSGRTAITYGLSPARPKVTVFSPVSCSMAAISKVPTEMMSARLPRKAGPGSKVSVSTKLDVVLVLEGLDHALALHPLDRGVRVVGQPDLARLAAMARCRRSSWRRPPRSSWWPRSYPRRRRHRRRRRPSRTIATRATPTRRLLRIILVSLPQPCLARDHRFDLFTPFARGPGQSELWGVAGRRPLKAHLTGLWELVRFEDVPLQISPPEDDEPGPKVALAFKAVKASAARWQEAVDRLWSRHG